jgi:hypothetical protein
MINMKDSSMGCARFALGAWDATRPTGRRAWNAAVLNPAGDADTHLSLAGAEAQEQDRLTLIGECRRQRRRRHFEVADAGKILSLARSL